MFLRPFGSKRLLRRRAILSFLCSSVFFLVILSTNHLFLVKMRNFPKKYLVVRKLYVNLHRKSPAPEGAGV